MIKGALCLPPRPPVRRRREGRCALPRWQGKGGGERGEGQAAVRQAGAWVRCAYHACSRRETRQLAVRMHLARAARDLGNSDCVTKSVCREIFSCARANGCDAMTFHSPPAALWPTRSHHNRSGASRKGDGPQKRRLWRRHWASFCRRGDAGEGSRGSCSGRTVLVRKLACRGRRVGAQQDVRSRLSSSHGGHGLPASGAPITQPGKKPPVRLQVQTDRFM